jgi:superfamily I DNA/RNA helicase
MNSAPRQLGLTGDDVSLDEVRQAIAKERRLGIRPTDIRVLEVEPVDGEDGNLWELIVEAQEPLPDAREWTGATLQRDLISADGDDGTWQVKILDVYPHTNTVWVEGERPTVGLAKVWPFDFLAALNKLVHEPRWTGLHAEFSRTLAASAGRAQPASIAAPGNHPAWSWSWTLVWGPPGTGKTYTLGEQVAALLSDPTEHVLVLSTTNRATDAAAVELGCALKRSGEAVNTALRVGRVVTLPAFKEHGLLAMLPNPDAVKALATAEQLVSDADGATARMHARREHRDLARQMPTMAWALEHPTARALVCTLYLGTRLLADESVLTELDSGKAPFTTVVLDEAGLVGRAQAAAVALLASRRVVLVGDPRQLSPISRATRSLPPHVMRWMARSGLEHLDTEALTPNVQRLNEQRRMHPDISEVVSTLQYGGQLGCHESVRTRPWASPLASLPRALWYVVDAHPGLGVDGASSARGPDNASRIRPATEQVLRALVEAEPSLRAVRGLFVTPYVAQATAATAWLKALKMTGWTASTVHSQQGAEAEVVLFDTVHASSTGWPSAEWCRLVNVGVSRAQQLVVVLCSRGEMEQGWMRPLRETLEPRVLVRRADQWSWSQPDGTQRAQAGLFAAPAPVAADEPVLYEVDASPTLGAQFERRRAQRAILSQEQRRLVHRELADAGPRLVRGVAGSGKTLVMAHWVVRTLRGQGFDDVVVMYANKSLRSLIERMLDDAWQQTHDAYVPPFPWERVHILHVADLLRDLRRERGLPEPVNLFDYEAQAQAIAELGPLPERFSAVFIDEAQDMGHAVLGLVVQLVTPHNGRKPVLVFYDNAQNLYGRQAPVWSELGLDMRGRSDVMRESFRSSRIIVETALNLLDRVGDGLSKNPDMRELMSDTLLVQRTLGAAPWWTARYCADDGQVPELYLAPNTEAEVAFVAARIASLVQQEGVRPGDIRVVTLSKQLREWLTPAIRAAVPGCVVVHVTGEGLVGRDDAVVITTPHSFKGYDAEVVLVPGVDRFAPKGNSQPQALYVSLTRARTLLIASASREGSRYPARQTLLDAFISVSGQLLE